MFIGHFAVALAAKRTAPRLPLGTLILAAQLADLVWPVLVLAGVERFAIVPGATAVTPLDFIHYPYSHSLVALALWGGVLAGVCYVWTRQAGISAVLFAVVLSHWLLDYISHRPDMPLTLGGPERVGLGLWDSIGATLAVEVPMFVAAIVLYARTTVALDRTGRWAFAAFIAFLAVIYVGAVFGPPPPSTEAVAWSGIGLWLLVAWGYWIDRHRAARMPAR